MGKKLSLTSFLFKPSAKEYASGHSSSSWAPWLSCSAARTDSFRRAPALGSSFFDSAESCFTRSSEEPESFSTVSEYSAGASPETVVRGLLRSPGRLLFEPSYRAGARSLLEEAEKASMAPPFDGAVAVAVETEDPYRDFRRSMEEMVATHGVSWDREKLWELLVWYLMTNREKNHGLIVGAFADLLAELASSSSSSSNNSSFETEENEEEATASS